MSGRWPPSQDDSSQEQEVEREIQPEIQQEPAYKQEKQPARDPFATAQPDTAVVPETKTATKKSPGLKMLDAKVTAGAAGARNIVLDKYWIQVGNNYPCGFNVKTLPDNDLEVTMQQLSYKRVYTGRGSLRTQVCPVEPIGTPGKVIAHDLTTGEIVEQPWVWHLIGFGGGSGLFSWLWQTIKNAVWPSK